MSVYVFLIIGAAIGIAVAVYKEKNIDRGSHKFSYVSQAIWEGMWKGAIGGFLVAVLFNSEDGLLYWGNTGL